MILEDCPMTEIDLTPRDIHPWVAEGADRIRFAISMFPQPPDWRSFIGLVQQMEAWGYDGYFAYDHPTANVDCWTSLAALAASTSTIRLGTLVDCIYYRSPYLLARQAADVDRLSGGRLVLGLGIGDLPSEFEQMGIPYPATPERLAAMEETIAIVRGLWSGEPFQFAGEHFTASAIDPFLGPVQEPRVPILLAGGGEKVTLRQVAQYADASNMGAHPSIGSAFTADEVRRKLGKLDDYLRSFDRAPESILRSHFTMTLVLAKDEAALARKMHWLAEVYGQAKLDWCGPALFPGTPRQAIAFYEGLAELGFRYFIANIFEVDEESIALLATDVMPEMA
jgi:alkanesulfonate monooxygenase SsuD/methylene tetrahydromethanopterin reductase-like flavin-dependent oxidoreductase (luciferase family)